VANHVLNDAILENVAQKMWAKELMAKYRNKYIIRWAVDQNSFLQSICIDKRDDDHLLTPKGKDQDVQLSKNITEFPYFKYNYDTILKRPQEEYEENEAVSNSFIVTYSMFSHPP
jgi:hypothetical protein